MDQVWFLFLAVLAGTLSLLTNFGLNLAVPRPRPFLVLPAHVLAGTPPHDPSFPSDHAAFTSAIGITVLLGGMVKWGAAGLLGAFAIGISRVIVGVHYPSSRGRHVVSALARDYLEHGCSGGRMFNRADC